MDLIRTILQKIELCEDPFGLDDMPEIKGCDTSQISYHVKLLCDADLIEADSFEESGMPYTDFINLNLTWAGQDFLDAARDDTLWNKAKVKLINSGTSFTFGLLLEWLEMKAKEKIGLS